jgi:hypothetical protein
MTRPRKQTVDYFPHSCDHGQTIFILEQRYGNDGYAFWFKLLELLGKTEGHFLDCKKPNTWHYLASKTLVDEKMAGEILDLLAELEAIDLELWTKERLVWSDNFLKGLAFAYRNRGVSIPPKPVIYADVSGICGTTKHRKPQSKVNEMKVNDIKDIAPPGPSDTAGAAFFFSCPYFDIDFNYRGKLSRTHPVMTDAALLKEFSKMEDWISDNKKTKTFKANGHLANPKLFITNWLDKVVVKGEPLTKGEKRIGALKTFLERGGIKSES